MSITLMFRNSIRIYQRFHSRVVQTVRLHHIDNIETIFLYNSMINQICFFLLLYPFLYSQSRNNTIAYVLLYSNPVSVSNHIHNHILVLLFSNSHFQILTQIPMLCPLWSQEYNMEAHQLQNLCYLNSIKDNRQS